MKGLIYAVVFTLGIAGCSSTPSSCSTRFGDHSGNLYNQCGRVTQNLTTGQTHTRVNNHWVQDLQTGKLKYTYGSFIEDK